MKTDLTQAFDLMNWQYLTQNHQTFGFPADLVS